MLPLSSLVAETAVVPVEVVFGTNSFALGTRYEKLGMTLCHAKNTPGNGGKAAGKGTKRKGGAVSMREVAPFSPAGSDSPRTAAKRTAIERLARESPMPLSISEVDGRLGLDSAFPGGVLYATERVFEDSCDAAFKRMFEQIFTQED